MNAEEKLNSLIAEYRLLKTEEENKGTRELQFYKHRGGPYERSSRVEPRSDLCLRPCNLIVTGTETFVFVVVTNKIGGRT